MAKHLDPSALPEDVARAAASVVAADPDQYPNVEAVVRAGVQAVERQQQRYAAKMEKLREAIDEGDRSGVFPGDPFENVRAELGLKPR